MKFSKRRRSRPHTGTTCADVCSCARVRRSPYACMLCSISFCACNLRTYINAHTHRASACLRVCLRVFPPAASRTFAPASARLGRRSRVRDGVVWVVCVCDECLTLSRSFMRVCRVQIYNAQNGIIRHSTDPPTSPPHAPKTYTMRMGVAGCACRCTREFIFLNTNGITI